MSKNTAFVIGNGASRKGFNLNLLRDHGTTYGCNLLYRESDNFAFPDYTVSIEDYRKEMIAGDKFPKNRCIFPPEEEQYENVQYYKDTMDIETKRGRRSNAGMNALEAAIKKGAPFIYILGFDFMINGEGAVSNMFSGKASTRCSFEDSQNRVKYYDWFCMQHPDVTFMMVFPRNQEIFYHKLEAINTRGMFSDALEDAIRTSNNK